MLASTSLPPVAPVPNPGPQATAPASAGTGGKADGPESFAHLLDQADARRGADQATADEPTTTAADVRPAGAGRAVARPCKSTVDERAAVSMATPGRDVTPEDGPAIDEASVTAAAGPTDAGTAPDATALLISLAALPRPALPTAVAAVAEGARRPPDDGRDNTLAGTTTPNVAAAPRGGNLDAPAPATTASTTITYATLMDAARAAAAAGELPEGRRADAAAPQTRAPAIDATPSYLMLPAAPAAQAAVNAAAPAVARLPAAPGSPDFAAQLGAQLTTFVREGVQHARLELHPVELGPVTVQIQIDGTHAQVNLAAEHAQTRQALEQALPALAGSLREAGLTLSGGGVFEQPRQPADPGASGASSGATGRRNAAGGIGVVDGAAGRLDAPALRRRGVVDLVA